MSSLRTHYDVIIIGTGAGGGTLAYRLAPSGKRILILERGDYVPREKDNWDSHAVNVAGEVPTREESWRDGDGKPLHPHTNYYVGGNTKFYGAALFRLRARGLRRAARTTAASRRPGRSATTSSSRTTPRPSTSITCTASAARIRPSRRPSAPYPLSRRSATSRACSSCSDDFARARAAGRSTCRSASCSTSSSPQTSRCIRCDTCDGFACLVQAKSDAQVVCVDPALRTRTSRC